MYSPKFLFLFLCVFLSLSIIPIVHAETDFNFLEFPEKVGEALFGGNTFAGGLMCTFILWLVFLLPILFLVREQSSMVALAAVLMLSSMIFCITVAIAWLDAWVLIFVVFTDVAFIAFSGVNKWFGGSP